MRLYCNIFLLLLVSVIIPKFTQGDSDENSFIKLAILIEWENTPNAQTTQNADSSQPSALSLADHRDAMETVSQYLGEVLDVDTQVLKATAAGHNKRHFKTHTTGVVKLNRTVRASSMKTAGQNTRTRTGGQRRVLGMDNKQENEVVQLSITDFLSVLRQANHLEDLRDKINSRSNSRSGRRQMLDFEGRVAPPTVSKIYSQPQIEYRPDKRFTTRTYANGKGAVDYIKAQTASRWNLDRINQPNLPLDGSVALPPFFFPLPSPAYIYMTDTVVYLNHTDFGGRASEVVNVYPDEVGICETHGSHTTGVAGGFISGVNPSSTLLSSRVLNCDGFGYTSDIITGLSLTLQDCIARGGGTTTGFILNMSWGGAGDPSTYASDPMYIILEEIRTTCDTVLIAAAGNSAADTCQTLPAGYPNVFAVGATDVNDNFASFSDDGPCVALNAPGVNILSVGTSSPTSFVTMSGTSDSAPLASGVASLHMSQRPPTWSQDHPGALFADNVVSKMLSDSNNARVTRRVPDTSTTTRILQVNSNPIEIYGLLGPVAPSPVSPNNVQTSDAISNAELRPERTILFVCFVLLGLYNFFFGGLHR